MGLKLCPFVDFVLGEKIMTCDWWVHIKKIHQTFDLAKWININLTKHNGLIYMGVKKIFMYSQVLNKTNDDTSFFNMSKTFISNT
jgi:hypothetical protein